MGKALGLAILLLLLLPTGVAAHHSTAAFARDKRLEVRGTLIEFKLRNPHSSFVIEGVGFIDGVLQGATPQRWEIESDATAAMRPYTAYSPREPPSAAYQPSRPRLVFSASPGGGNSH